MERSKENRRIESVGKRMFGQFLAENISFEIGKILMIEVYLKLIVWNGWIPGIYGNSRVSARNVFLTGCAWEF